VIATPSPGKHELVRALGADLVLVSVGPLARREYDAYGLPFHDAAHAVGSLAEACTVIRRLWTETEPFDFHGTYLQLTGAFGNPKPVQRPHPPILISALQYPH
jgi:alkanesulfonate monooxygenase SsuD/methylene tetrahydromethanopterin reductase-like flavin-dependent oxidoreductase (luciferase family)